MYMGDRQDELRTMQCLKPILKDGSVVLRENIMANMDGEVGRDSDDEAIERGMMELA